MSDPNYSTYWRTKRIVDIPQTPKEWEQVWTDIRAVFRPRSGGREGCLYTNHQGLIAVLSTVSTITNKPLDILITDGITLNWPLAQEVKNTLLSEARSWTGKARIKLQELGESFNELLANAMLTKKLAVAIVDTTTPSLDGSRWGRLKSTLRHEATHVWRRTVNDRNPGLIREEKMISDPEYPVLSQILGRHYEDPTAPRIYDEGVTYAIAGKGLMAGLPTKGRTNGFLARFFTEVKREYGQEALDLLRLAHPNAGRVLAHIKDESVERDVRADTKLVGLPIQRNDFFKFDLEIRLGEQASIGNIPQGDLDLVQRQALEKIAAINLSNPSEMRSWSQLGRLAVGLAREALAGLGPAENGTAISALRQIAKMEPVNTGDKRLSWKNVAEKAVETAREAWDLILQSANVQTNVVMSAAEVTREIHRNERAPARGIDQ